MQSVKDKVLQVLLELGEHYTTLHTAEGCGFVLRAFLPDAGSPSVWLVSPNFHQVDSHVRNGDDLDLV